MGQEAIFHKAQQLYIGAGRLSKPGASQGWLSHVWAPNGSSAACSGLWVYTHTCSGLVLHWKLAFGCYFGTIFWVR